MDTKDRYILFPVGFTVREEAIREDNVEDVGLYQVVDTATDYIVGEVGITVGPDEKYGYDALWSWRTADGQNVAASPFLTVSDALDNFIAEVSE